MSMPLMPSERLCLKRTRHKLIQTMDVATILPPLRAANHFTVQEEQTIMADPRRRDRVALFLDMVAQKGTETFKAFSNVLADQSPHLYLTMSEWDKEDSFDSGPSGMSSKRQKARADDEWSTLNRCRSSLMAQIDAGKLVPLIAGNVLSSSQKTAILSEPVRERRTAMLLDWLETKPADAFHAFVEAVGELYPHVYLELTGSGRDDDDW